MVLRTEAAISQHELQQKKGLYGLFGTDPIPRRAQIMGKTMRIDKYNDVVVTYVFRWGTIIKSKTKT